MKSPNQTIVISLLVALSMVVGCSSTPTVPLPPPNALSSAPGMDGLVSIRGNGALPGAVVIAYNENTGAGVLATASDAGEFTLELAASVGDSILVWQRAGASSGEQVNIIVPMDPGGS